MCIFKPEISVCWNMHNLYVQNMWTYKLFSNHILVITLKHISISSWSLFNISTYMCTFMYFCMHEERLGSIKWMLSFSEWNPRQWFKIEEKNEVILHYAFIKSYYFFKARIFLTSANHNMVIDPRVRISLYLQKWMFFSAGIKITRIRKQVKF